MVEGHHTGNEEIDVPPDSFGNVPCFMLSVALPLGADFRALSHPHSVGNDFGSPFSILFTSG